MTTGIQWTEETWNPVTGCSKISPGCEHCYAEKEALGRLKGSAGYPGLPWTKQNARTNVILHPGRLMQPVRWQRPRMIFVNSMSDLWHENVPFSFISEVMGSILLSPQHTYQSLTKRVGRMVDYFDTQPIDAAIRAAEYWAKANFKNWAERMRKINDRRWPPENLWLGFSAEDQPRFDARFRQVQEMPTPPAVLWVSAEPLLGPIDLRFCSLCGCATHHTCIDGTKPFINWVVIGGESGAEARACDLAWIRQMVDKCNGRRIPVFVKQLGSKPFDSQAEHLPVDVILVKHHKGGDMKEWPRDLRIREYPIPPVYSAALFEHRP